MQKVCTQCSAAFEVTDDDLKFYQQISPEFGGKKELISPPNLCPDCRAQKRMVWRNERNLHKRACALCANPIVCMYHPDAPYAVLCETCWHSDTWDAFTYAQERDTQKSFFQQYDDLLQVVPHRGLFITGISENSEYVNWAGPCKNCYLVFNSGLIEDCYYAKGFIESRDCMDMLTCQRCEHCYECINVSESYNVIHAQNCNQCRDSAFLFNCIGCSHCIGCANLRHAEYCIFNEQKTKEEYEQVMETLKNMQDKENLCQEFTALVLQATHRQAQIVNAENCTGDYLFNTKDCQYCFEVSSCEDCSYTDCSKRCKSSQDLYGFGYDSELLYQVVGVGYSFHVLCSVQCENCTDCMYCFQCNDSQNLFGCVGLRHAQYCIFNTQYTKEKYEKRVAEIIEQMKTTHEYGEFFPTTLSPFRYNETVANEYFPLKKEGALAKGYSWRDIHDELPQTEKTILTMQLPQSIQEIPDDVLNWALICEETGRPFKIIKQELDFYRQMKLPIPHFHPDERHKRRMAQRNPRKLWERKCDKCSKEIQTTYSPERKEIVYCEECYVAEVY